MFSWWNTLYGTHITSRRYAGSSFYQHPRTIRFSGLHRIVQRSPTILRNEIVMESNNLGITLDKTAFLPEREYSHERKTVCAQIFSPPDQALLSKVALQYPCVLVELRGVGQSIQSCSPIGHLLCSLVDTPPRGDDCGDLRSWVASIESERTLTILIPFRWKSGGWGFGGLHDSGREIK